MSKRPSRPWDRQKGIDRFSSSTTMKTAARITPDVTVTVTTCTCKCTCTCSGSTKATQQREEEQQREQQREQQQQASDSKSKSYNPPFLTVDENTYYSDRFYLLKSEDGSDDDDDNDDTSQAILNSACSCGAQQAPPTLDRKQLIKSLSLKAAIVATFTVSPSYLTDLFGDNVPTLVLHGHKGLHNRMQHNTKDGTAVVSSTTRKKDDESPLKKKKISGVTNNYRPPAADQALSSSSVAVKKEEEESPEGAWFRTNRPSGEEQSATIKLPDTIHFTQILSAWLPPSRVHTARQTATNSSKPPNNSSKNGDCGVIELLDDSSDDEMPKALSFSGIDAATIRQRRSKRGVHHPKFMLLFETSGSLVVVVSTSNLTTPKCSVDGIWVQRFFPTTTTTTIKKKKNKKMQERRMDGSDFGHVLADFLQKQSNAARVGQMLPLEFLQHYNPITAAAATTTTTTNHDATTATATTTTLESYLTDAYQFDESRVHLIATVPGDYMGRGSDGVTHCGKRNSVTGQRSFLYGPQRVQDIMVRLANDRQQQTSSSSDSIKKNAGTVLLQSNEDRLICQPTSLGGHWTTSDFNALAKCYMGDGEDDYGRTIDLLERTDILWPSRSFIKRIQKGKRYIESDGEDDSDDEGAGFIFLSSQSFNTIDVDCISRMVQYDHSSPHQTSSLRCPHFKSYARLFEGNEYDLRRNHGVGKAAELFSWFLMTSACLSRGAQGAPTTDRMEGSDQATYANFELGILFCSTLRQGSAAGSDRVYCFKPNQCTCGGTNPQDINNNKKLIHLPIPYSVRGRPYHTDPEEAHMCKTPYFHEITPETACVGLMTLTPFGKARAAKQTSGTLTTGRFS